MNDIIFSVLIPVYNTEKYLPRALNSIIKQTFDLSKIEVIVVNDGSSNTELCDTIVKDYSEKISIKYIKKEKNEGLYLARKKGVEIASGKYYLNLDADDEHVPEAYTILYRAFLNNDGLDYIQFNILNIGKKINKFKNPDCQDITLKSVLEDDQWISMCYRCFNTKFLKMVYSKMKEFYAVTIEDFYQGIIVSYYASKKASIDDYLYKRYLDIGISSSNSYQNYYTFLKMDESVQNVFKHLDLFFSDKEDGIYKSKRQKFYNKFYIDAFNLTRNQIVVDMILNRIDAKYLLFSIMNRLNKLENILQEYDSLLPIAKRLNKPVNFIRSIKRFLKK